MSRPVFLALLLAILSCGGSARKEADEPLPAEEPEKECCCQRYNENGNPTGAAMADESACKSTGGTCTDDLTQCESD